MAMALSQLDDGIVRSMSVAAVFDDFVSSSPLPFPLYLSFSSLFQASFSASLLEGECPLARKRGLQTAQA
jgi:hypothetical protein